MGDFSKITNHPDKKDIISKLIRGDNPKVVSKYLKDQYSKPEEAHLRVPASLLQEFRDKYADTGEFAKKVFNRQSNSKLDKKIAESLLDNRTWKERVNESIDKEIDYMDHLDRLLVALEIRTEQLFDLIQQDPENTRTDYIFTKYSEILMLLLEKADKIRNDKPDIKIEHTYTVQMVEQQTVAFQEAIRRVLERMNPEISSIFLDLLNEEMGNIKPQEINPLPAPRRLEKEKSELDKLDVKMSDLDAKFDDDKEEE